MVGLRQLRNRAGPRGHEQPRPHGRRAPRILSAARQPFANCPRLRAVLFLAAILLPGLSGCASPRDTAFAIARDAGLQAYTLRGETYVHQAWFRPARAAGPRQLHVYLDHDGTPWLRRDSVAADPTPRNPLALRLMAQDEAAGLYLGRPCHFAPQADPACHPLAWTHRRYGEPVVASLAVALQGFIEDKGYRRVVLVGYSGGGTLALLLADRVPAVTSVITIAGNLDVAGWAALHGHSPLDGSLDPLRRTRRNPPAREFHLVGARDANVTPALSAGYLARFPDATRIELAGYDHVCCWARDWHALLAAPALRSAFAPIDTPRETPD